MTEPAEPCLHRRTRLVASGRDVEYRECLDCGRILEKDESGPPEPAPFDDSLSDA